MNRWSSELLEYESLREILRRFIPSPLGQEKLNSMEPLTERAAIESSLEETAEAIAFLDRQRESRTDTIRLRFSDLPDVRHSTSRLHIEGVVLDGLELFELGTVLDRAMDARTVLGQAGGRLAARVETIPDLRHILRQLDGKLMPDGSVADDASVALSRLRRDRVRQQAAIQESLDRFLREHKDDGILQESFITVRNDRFVVPVVTSQRKRVDGVIHGSSGTGQTMFIEPMETIGLNNDLVRISEEEMREVHRILRELTALFHQAGPSIPQAVEALAWIEFIFGKAEYALSFDCSIPRLSPENPRTLRLTGARHPLLADLLRKQKKPIIPVNIELTESARTLLITGPNTGGKTVAMKTVGLSVLMTQSGLPVPCATAELPLFEEVLADIGDNQSIAESLSSFSAHVRRLSNILEHATPESLVLLDELGRATDPEEGGALGVAMVDELRLSGAFTLASTHLLALKVYGANTPGVVNGSMGFDEETLTTTYVLRTGAPGRSAGLAIASRLGLPPRLIEKAQSAMSSNERDIARFLTELHTRLESATQLEDEFRKKLSALTEREQQLEASMAKKEAQKLAEVERKAASLVAELEAKSRTAIEEIRATAEQRKAADQARVAASRTIRQMREATQSTLRPESAAAPSSKLEEGTRVRLSGIREPARVRKILSNGNIEVEAGFLKMQVPQSDITEILSPGDTGTKLPRNVTFESGPSWTTSQREINLIGKTAAEAQEELERFIDRASMASVDRIRIIHGHGMGVLKRMVADTLRDHPLVDRVEAASSAEGGSGATIAWLRN